MSIVPGADLGEQVTCHHSYFKQTLTQMSETLLKSLDIIQMGGCQPCRRTPHSRLGILFNLLETPMRKTMRLRIHISIHPWGRSNAKNSTEVCVWELSLGDR